MEKRRRQGVSSVSQHFPHLELRLLVIRSPPRCRDTFEKGRHPGAGKTLDCLDSPRGHPVSSVPTCQAPTPGAALVLASTGLHLPVQLSLASGASPRLPPMRGGSSSLLLCYPPVTWLAMSCAPDCMTCGPAHK